MAQRRNGSMAQRRNGSTAQWLNGKINNNLIFITLCAFAPLCLCAIIPPQIYKL
jgi:hypothetical protein